MTILAFAALAAWIVWWLLGRTATRTATRTRQPPVRPRATTAGPPPNVQPGEIWWAYVPFRDTNDEKHRPCLVLTVQPDSIGVLKITSQDKSHRRDHLRIPTLDWDRTADHDSFLDISAPIHLGWHDLDHRAGTIDAFVWQQVRQLHPTGSSGPPPYPGTGPSGGSHPGSGPSVDWSRTRALALRAAGAAVAFLLVLCCGLGCLDIVRQGGQPDAAKPEAWLYELSAVATEGGESGQQVDSTLGDRRYPESTGLWVGCESSPASVTYQLDGGYRRLTATAGLDAHTPQNLTARIVVSADGKSRVSVTVSRKTTARVDVDLTGVRLLTLSAQRTRGTCGTASRPYGALGDAVLLR
ncbi:NPCBM/NEW2 domain-containing protein [Micromonospora echinofusca]|uniref:Glycosyl hydrolase family 98 putative carbohydrate-binding module domain-containing protein n=1 Tax=Micromonospora echinofusca TaxID=47858 RepID=A0ABS3VS36_MICEH|nr:NPCBM/NEW2 domain-containing protein [Micromonospora echinofusca]MBO4207281.1 hypothetical protein [Micromonospora echinofusca]